LKALSIIGLTIAFCLGSSETKAQSAGPITRYPSIHNGVYSEFINWNDIAESGQFPKFLITEEGDLSDPNSSWQGMMDYFAVYAPNLEGHATALVMSPIATDENGVTAAPVYFRDVLNNVNYSIPDATKMQGTFTLGGQTIYVKITYDPKLGVRYPQVQLTWGDGASYGNVGDIIDDFSTVQLDVESPVGMTLGTMKTPNEEGAVDGFYLGNYSQYGDGYVIQSSTDMTNWTDEDNQPLYIVGYTYVHWFPITIGEQHRYFRARKLP